MDGRGRNQISAWHKLSIAVCAAVLIYNIAVLYFNCFYGAVFDSDEPYMALNCKYYGDGPLAMLSFYIGHIAQSIFGEQLIVLRLLSRTWILIAIAIPLIYFYRRSRNLAWTFGLAAFMIVYQMEAWNLFWGWDVGPLVWESATFTVMISFIDRPTLRKAVAAGALCALMVLSRVTTAAIGVPLLFAVMLMMRRNYKGFTFWKVISYACVAFLLTFLFMIILMKGSVMAYIDSWIPENIINGHQFDELGEFIMRFKGELKLELMGYSYWVHVLVMAGVIVLYLKVFRWKGLIVVPVIIWYMGLKSIFVIKDDIIPHYFVPFVLLAYPYVRRIFDKKCSVYPPVKLLMILLFPLVTGFGSDSMLKRSVLFIIIPEMVLMIYPYRNGIIKWLFVLIVSQHMVFHAYRSENLIKTSTPAWNDYRYHEYIRHIHREGLDEILALRPYIGELKANGVEFVFMSEYRYLPSYLYCDGKPYNMHHFHFYYEDESKEFLEECLNRGYVVITKPSKLPYFPYERLIEKAREMGATITHDGAYDYIEPVSVQQKLRETRKN